MATRVKSKIAICFGQFAPYTHARVLALQSFATSVDVIPMQIAAESSTYQWSSDGIELCANLRTLCTGTLETSPPLQVFLRARKFFRDERIGVAFLASYWPAPQLALAMAAKSLGIPTVMMSDSHAGTERAAGLKKRLKRRIV